MKRVFGVFLLCVLLLTVPVSAAPDIRIDGDIHVFTEYGDTGTLLASERHDTNCALNYAYMQYVVDIPNYQLYLAFQYNCDDYVPNGGKTGVEITINGLRCAAFFADGTIDAIDPYYFASEHAFSFQDELPSEIRCEIRIGVKYGFDRDTVVGVRFFDCSGEPSNYYEVTVYTIPTTTAPKTTTTKAPKTTAEHQTTEVKNTQTKAAHNTTAVLSRTQSEVKTARDSTVTNTLLTLATRSRSAAVTVPEKNAAATNKMKKAEKAKKTTSEKSTTVPASVHSTQLHTQADISAVTAPCTTDISVTVSAASVSGGTIRYKRFSKAKTVGIAAAASLLTAAVMVSVFLYVTGSKKADTDAEKRD